jgi:hypoxanthine phosphoribosyltransferase
MTDAGLYSKNKLASPYTMIGAKREQRKKGAVLLHCPSMGQIEEACYNIAKYILKRKIKIHTIIAPARGGWIPARIVCDFLGQCEEVEIKDQKRMIFNSPNLVNIGVKRYGPLEGNQLNIYQDISEETQERDIIGKNVLIVDDVFDAGETLRRLHIHIKKMKPSKLVVSAVYKKARPYGHFSLDPDKRDEIRSARKQADDYFGKRILFGSVLKADQVWTIFPWEAKEGRLASYAVLDGGGDKTIFLDQSLHKVKINTHAFSKKLNDDILEEAAKLKAYNEKKIKDD